MTIMGIAGMEESVFSATPVFCVGAPTQRRAVDKEKKGNPGNMIPETEPQRREILL